MLRLIVLALAATLMVSGCASTPAPSEVTPSSGQPAEAAFLDELLGDWVLEGQVMGEPVRYRAHGRRVLGNAWLEFHMADVEHAPPAYEARVFVSWDAKAGDYVVHWLDGFGASGARVAGIGVRNKNILTIDFPYASGAFRNAWTRSAEGWSMSADAQQPDGTWRNFGSLSASRP